MKGSAAASSRSKPHNHSNHNNHNHPLKSSTTTPPKQAKPGGGGVSVVSGGVGQRQEPPTTQQESSTSSSSSAASRGGVRNAYRRRHKQQGNNSNNATAFSAFPKFREWCGTAVNHPRVQLAVVACIAINSLMMGIQTFDFVKNDPAVLSAFDICDQFFLALFTVELGMQFCNLGHRLLLDGWLVFDLVVIATSWGFDSLQIVRAFRIFRALRLITRISVMQNLILALIGVVPRMFAIATLLLLISYIFAVLFTQLFKDMYAREDIEIDQDYFGRMDSTFFTLFQIVTLDGWADVARQVMVYHRWAWLPIVIYVIISGFVVVNLFIAVICDAISALHDDEKAKLHGGHVTSEEEAEPVADVQTQLTALEEHVAALTRMQDETLRAVAALTNQLAQTNRQLREGSERGP